MSKGGEKAQVSAELQQFIAQEQAKAQVRWNDVFPRSPSRFPTCNRRRAARPDVRLTSPGRDEPWSRRALVETSPGRPCPVARVPSPVSRRPCPVARVPSPASHYASFLLCPSAVQLQQTISRLTDECWDKCVSSPSTYFSGKENACLDNCAKRFMDTTQFVIKYFNSKNARTGGGEGFDEFS